MARGYASKVEVSVAVSGVWIESPQDIDGDTGDGVSRHLQLVVYIIIDLGAYLSGHSLVLVNLNGMAHFGGHLVARKSIRGQSWWSLVKCTGSRSLCRSIRRDMGGDQWRLKFAKVA